MIKICTLICLYFLPCFGMDQTNLIMNMTLEEKVGQLLMVHFQGEVANEDAKTLIQDVKVGGIIYYNWANQLNSPEQVRTLSTGLQELAQKNKTPIPLFIAADQEGGIVSRLNDGFTIFPGNKALGIINDPALTENAAQAMGEELQAVGVNMNLAPVVDVNSNPRNPIIGIRSFGSSPETVFIHGKKAVEGYKQAGIIATLKHFPGHGDVNVDSHTDLPIIHKSVEELEAAELLPFTKLAHSVDAIMTAHILVPALDKEHCTTLSKTTLTYLKETLGFKGVIIADSLIMQGVLKECQNIDSAVIQALNAGCDILLLGGRHLVHGNTNTELTVADIKQIHQSIIAAVKCGRISEERLFQAVEKILKLKEKYLFPYTPTDGSTAIQKMIHSIEHQALAQKIASHALQTIKNKPIPPIDQMKMIVIAPQILRSLIEKTSLLTIGDTPNSTSFYHLNPSISEIETIIQQAKTSDLILVFSYNAWKNTSQEALIRSLLNIDKPLILVVTRDPLDAELFSQANLIFTTFSPTTPSIQAVCNSIHSYSSAPI